MKTKVFLRILRTFSILV